MADRPRLLLIVNPKAQAVSPSKQRAVADLLALRYRIEQILTEGPGHATELAYKAGDAGVDAVAVLGGDGSVNEAANGLAGMSTPLAVIPGGGADVFARSLGIPKDAVAAAHGLVRVGGAEPRMVSLGVVLGSAEGDRRYFLANCGMGFDAAIVRSVERHQRRKRLWGDWYFVWTGIRTFFGGFDRHTPHLELEAEGTGGASLEPSLFLVIVQNTNPFTYFGDRPLNLCPRATIEEGLDAFALRTMGIGTVLPILASALGSARGVVRPQVASLHDRLRLQIRSDTPMPVQVDGEFIGERTGVTLESAPNALSLLR